MMPGSLSSLHQISPFPGHAKAGLLWVLSHDLTQHQLLVCLNWAPGIPEAQRIDGVSPLLIALECAPFLHCRFLSLSLSFLSGLLQQCKSVLSNLCIYE